MSPVTTQDPPWVAEARNLKKYRDIVEQSIPDSLGLLMNKKEPKDYVQMRIDMDGWGEPEVAAFQSAYEEVRRNPDLRKQMIDTMQIKKSAAEMKDMSKMGMEGAPAIAREPFIGIKSGVNSLVSLGVRSFSSKTADKINRENNYMNQVADEAAKGDKTPDWLQSGVRGATRSIYQASALKALGAGTYGIIAGFAATRGNEAITESTDAGLTAKQKWGYVGRAAAIEGGIAGAFQMMGFGGFEKMVGGGSQLTEAGVKAVLKSTGINFLQELPEENITEILDQYNQVASKVDPGEMSWPKAWEIMKATTIQVAMAVGFTGATQGIASQEALKQRDQLVSYITAEHGLSKEAARKVIDEASESKGNFEESLGRKLIEEATKTPEGLAAWIETNPDAAEAVASKESPSRDDFETAGLPRVSKEERIAIAEEIRVKNAERREFKKSIERDKALARPVEREIAAEKEEFNRNIESKQAKAVYEKNAPRIEKVMADLDEVSTGIPDNDPVFAENQGLIEEIGAAIQANNAGLVVEKVNVLTKKIRNRKSNLPKPEPETTEVVPEPAPEVKAEVVAKTVDIKKKPRLIRSAAYRMSDGSIFEGTSHPSIVHEQSKLGKSYKDFYGTDAEAGFVTKDGKFVNREEAFKLTGKSNAEDIGGPFGIAPSSEVPETGTNDKKLTKVDKVAEPAKAIESTPPAPKAKIGRKGVTKKAAKVLTPAEAYDSAKADFRKESKTFMQARESFRAKKIDDKEFLAAKAKFDKAQSTFDKAEDVFIEASNDEDLDTGVDYSDEEIESMRDKSAALEKQMEKAMTKPPAKKIGTKGVTKKAQKVEPVAKKSQHEDAWIKMSGPQRSIVLSRLGIAGPRSWASEEWNSLTEEAQKDIAGVMKQRELTPAPPVTAPKKIGTKGVTKKQPAPEVPAFSESIKNDEIYKLAAGGQERFAIHEEENKRGFGDSVYKTYEEAVTELKRRIELRGKNAEFNRKQAERQAVEDEKLKKAESERNDLDGFADDYNPLKLGSARKVLNKVMTLSSSKPDSIKNHIRGMLRDGTLKTETREEPKIKPMTRMQAFRADNRESAEHEKRMKEAGNKTVYYVNNYDLGKTAYDYANHLLNKQPAKPAAVDNNVNAIEYITRDVFKGKSPKSAIKSFVKKFKGSENMFLGDTSRYDADSLMKEYVSDKAQTAIDRASRMKPGRGFMALEGTAKEFGLSTEELSVSVKKLLGDSEGNGILSSETHAPPAAVEPPAPAAPKAAETISLKEWRDNPSVRPEKYSRKEYLIGGGRTSRSINDAIDAGHQMYLNELKGKQVDATESKAAETAKVKGNTITPPAGEETAPVKRSSKRLGENADSVWKEFVKLSKSGVVSKYYGIVYPVASVVGGQGIIRYKDGKLYESTGGGIGLRELTDAETEEFHSDLERDAVEIRTTNHWGGSGDKSVKFLDQLHQSKGMSFKTMDEFLDSIPAKAVAAGEKKATAGSRISDAPPSVNGFAPAPLPKDKIGKKLTQPADVITAIKRDWPELTMSGPATFKKKAPGWYDNTLGTIRLKDMRNVEVALHELGHHFDKLLNKWSGQGGKAKGMPEELERLGRDIYGKKVPVGGYASEGFAELTRAYLSGESSLPGRAPLLYDWLTTYLSENPVEAKRMANLEMLVNNLQLQTPEERVRAFRHPIKKDWSVPRLIANSAAWVDDYIRDTNLIYKRVMDKAGVTENEVDKHPYCLAMTLSQTAPGRTKHAVMVATTDLFGIETGESLYQAKEAVSAMGQKTEEQFWDYMIASRVVNLSERGIFQGVDAETAKLVIAKYDSSVFRDSAKRVTDWSRRILQLLVQAGVATQSEIDAMEALNPIYVPFSKQFQKDERRPEKSGKSGGRGVYKIRSNSNEINHPLDALIWQAERIFTVAAQGMVKKSVVDLYNKAEKTGDHKALGQLLRPVPPPMDATTFSAEHIKKQMADKAIELGADPIDVKSAMMDEWDELLTIYTKATQYKGSQHITKMTIAGETKWYEVTPEFYTALESLKGIKKLESPLWETIRIASKAAVSLTRIGATQLNPGFGLARNLMRDDVTSGVTGEYVNRIPLVTNLIGTFEEAFGDNEYTRKYDAMAVSLSGWYGQDARSTDKLKKQSSATTFGKKTFVEISHPIELARAILGATEAGPRYTEFKAAYKSVIDAGGTEQAAVVTATMAGNNISVNFKRSGYLTREANLVSTFLGAGVQSWDKFIMAFKYYKGEKNIPKATSRTLLRAGAWITFMSLMSYYKNRDEKWWQELPAHEKWTHTHWKIGKLTARIPQAFEFGLIFGSLPMAIIEEKRNPGSIKEWWQEFQKLSSPIDLSSLAGALRSVQLIAPVVDIVSNSDWKGDEIIPSYLMDSKEKQDWYTSGTSKTAIKLSKVMNESAGVKLSPAQLEYVVNGYTGGIYKRMAGFFDTVKDSSRMKEPSKLPVVGTVFLRDNTSRITSDFYSKLETLTQKKGSGTATLEELGELALANRLSGELTDKWDARREADDTMTAEKSKPVTDKIMQSIFDDIRKHNKEDFREAGIRSVIYSVTAPVTKEKDKAKAQRQAKEKADDVKQAEKLLEGIPWKERYSALRYEIKRNKGKTDSSMSSSGKLTAYGARLKKLRSLK